MTNNYELLTKELVRLWDKDRAEIFLEIAKKNLDEDQLLALSKMILYVEDKYEDLDEETLSTLMMGMDTFDGPLEFLEYFFKMTQEDVADVVVARLKEDPEEAEAMLESMEDSGLIEYFAEMDSFYVWYKI